MLNKIPPLSSPNKSNELEAFDNLPTELRDKINYLPDRIDPRFILGIMKSQGVEQALSYLDDTCAAQGKM